MASASDQIFVQSHTARDLLQSAALFKTDRLAVWEYVVNGLQYTDSGTNPIVRVMLDTKKKRIVVADNGRGMDWTGLQNFFVMHGENIDRKQGRPGRGLFGTGKAAAFGIADLLRITTVRSRKRSKVELTRGDILAMSSGDPVPVKVIEREISCSDANGTVVEIEGIHLRALDQAGVIAYIERHLARWPKNASVFVNNHECEYSEPPIAEQHSFVPEGPVKEKLGDARLVLKVSKGPLSEDLRGVSVFANGVWYETTLAGSEGRDMSQYIFGEIDVPQLDEDKSPISPFDMSRSMKLNPSNELVQTICAFIGQKVEEIRRALVEADKQRKAGEDARKLAEQANEIARFLNEDFEAFRRRVAKAKANAVGGADAGRIVSGGGDEDDDLLFGGHVPAKVILPAGGPGAKGNGHHNGEEPRALNPEIVSSPEGDVKGHPAGGTGAKPKPRGGFLVKFANTGQESYRAQYVRDERTIYINLDHPQLVAALGIGSVDDPIFRRLAYEVAFSEYAVALASELAARDEYLDPTDPIVDIRETLNRLARRGATLYSA